MTTGFIQTFGGQLINPTNLGYVAYTIASNLQLTWPIATTPAGSALAPHTDVTASGPGLSILFPDATLVTTGQDALISNPGVNTFSVQDFSGNNIGSVASGQSWYFYLTDNTTQHGVWRALQFGAGVSQATAASLAGAGLKAIALTLNQNLPIVPLNGNYNPGVGDRATVLQNVGGVVTYAPTSAAILGLGWFVYIMNSGGGNLTWNAGGQTIDGASTKVLAPGENAIVFSDGANFFTLGYGRSLVTTVTAAAISLAAASGVVSLTNNQASAQVQDFVGALGGNVILNYGTGAGYWFVFNNTTGANTVTARVNGSDAGVVVPQAVFSIIRSNGANMNIAFTATSGTVTNIATATGQLTGGPITSTGTIGLATTAVAAGTYGDASHVSTMTVDTFGRITAGAQTLISIPLTQVQTFTSVQLLAQMSTSTGTGLNVFNNAPALVNATGTTQAPGDNTTLLATDAFVTTALLAVVTTGDIKATLASPSNTVAPAGWVFMTVGTIGDGSSGASLRANADTQALFILLWTTFSDGICPVTGGRGGSAAADYAAHKVIAMIDSRGCALVSAEDMGGSNRGNLGGQTSVGAFTGTASIGTQAGQSVHTMTLAELVSHRHTLGGGFQIGANGGGGVTGGGNVMQQTGSISQTDLTGSTAPFNVTQPSVAVWHLVKL